MPSRLTASDGEAIVRLGDDLGMSWPEVSKATGIPTSTLHRHYQRAKGIVPASRRRPKVPLASVAWDEMVLLYEAGAITATDLAEDLGTTASTVRNYLSKHGAERQTRMQLPVDDDKLRDLRAAGATYKELAAECRVSPTLIWRRLHFLEEHLDRRRTRR